MRPDIVRQIRKEMCIQRRRSGSSLVRQKRRWTEHQHAKAGQQTLAENKVKINDLSNRINETKKAAATYNDQMRSVIESLEVQVIVPKIAEMIHLEIAEIIRAKDESKQLTNKFLTNDQLTDVAERVLAYLKSKLLCPDTVTTEDVVAHLISQQEPLQLEP